MNSLDSVAIAGLVIVAIDNRSWFSHCAAVGIDVAARVKAPNARLTISVQLLIVNALAGGLGAEIV